MALLVAMVTSINLPSITASDKTLIGRALVDLQRRGFNIQEALETLRQRQSGGQRLIVRSQHVR